MGLPKPTVGLACILLSIVVTRVAVHLSSASQYADPRQIWMSLSAGTKAVVFGSFLLFVFGAGTVVLAMINSLTRRRS